MSFWGGKRQAYTRVEGNDLPAQVKRAKNAKTEALAARNTAVKKYGASSSQARQATARVNAQDGLIRAAETAYRKGAK